MIIQNVQFVDLKRMHDSIRDELNRVINNVVDDSSFITGNYLSSFEDEFAKYVGTKYCIGVASGSDALYIGLRALGIKPGDEIIVPSFTFTATVDAVVRNGAIPVFIDVGENYNIGPEQFKNAITEKTKAVIPVHLYGNPCNISEIMEIAHANDIFVIEDSAQSHGALYRGNRTGAFGDISCFSFYPAKNLGAFGDGGAICTNSSVLNDRIRMIREYGQSRKYYHDFIGINSRLDSIQASILNVKLKYLDYWNSLRKATAKLYGELLEDTGVILPHPTESSEHVYHIYAVRHKKRDKLKNHLLNRGIATGVHYPIPVHLLKSYSNIGIRHDLINTERFANEEISLPMFPFLKDNEVVMVSEAIRDFVRSSKDGD